MISKLNWDVLHYSLQCSGNYTWGGAGTRLYPLTKKRTKPAVPLRANYRLIDIPVRNCLNSNISKIYVLTQFNFASLNRHLSRAYASNMGGCKNEGVGNVVDTLGRYFLGIADVVRQYLWLFEEHNVMEYLILVGDHLYRMDYEKFIQAHRETGVNITVVALPMDEKCATAFGLMKIDEECRIIEFAEKLKGEQLKAMNVDTTILGLDDERAKEMPYIASMGIYVVSKNVMLNLLRDKFPGANDFGSEVIPGVTSIGMRNRSVIALKSDQVGNYRVAFGQVSGCTHSIMGPGKVQAYLYDGYWEDIGTIEAFYNANLGIAKKPVPDFSFYDRSSPIYTQPRYLPPSKMLDSYVTDSVIYEGCVIKVYAKRSRMHRVSKDENGNVKIKCPTIGKQFATKEIFAQVLRKLVDDASKFFNDKVTKAVVTVPAYFNDSQRTIIKDVGRIAGLEVLRIINEPTTASLVIA
ncbi:hypothetical protein GIB67_041005 [Kingdonia uniflora]|uniref:glucose-1-phosphate adenylyltransferase n=1 Tax=Kingdonia uniflora TaxID=39325 RepID=A0A7J7NCE6_9MAGN|nr:hypothetical protein GIB67_041005 [Kingdonia uniflora]